MKTVYVLGNGQLSQMLQQAAQPLAIKVQAIGQHSTLAMDTLSPDAVITAEIEQWPVTPLTEQLCQSTQFINRHVFPIIADRYQQKQLLEQLSLPTAAWQLLASPDQWPKVYAHCGDQVIVKRRCGGYDGRGQWRLHAGTESQLPADCYQQTIVEQVIPFSAEVSLVGARNQAGDHVFYPLCHNYHQQGILRASLIDQQRPFAHLQSQAEQMLGAIMQQLGYVGVMAMECFVVNDQLMINELAPRVHNSGHWSQAGASISQFTLHLQAILDLPLVTPVVTGHTVMVNLIGVPLNYQWLRQPLVQLHWYDKEVRAGRKVGHLNLHHHDSQLLSQQLQQLMPLLDNASQLAIAWLNHRLSTGTCPTL